MITNIRIEITINEIPQNKKKTLRLMTLNEPKKLVNDS